MTPSLNLTERAMCISILGIHISPISYATVSKQVLGWAKTAESRYICAANVHMLMESFDSLKYGQIINSADLVTPDGMPLVWVMRLKGKKDQQRVYGPTLMLHVLEAAARENIPVGFYGSSPEVLGGLSVRMKTRFPNLKINYLYSPPFGALGEAEDAKITQEIARSGVRILFIGLGCPKQEIWMAKHCGKIQVVMLGVGAAFDFHAGTKPQAPSWMQKIGLEWFYRLAAEPRRLWKRYLYHNPRFVLLATLDLLKHIFKVKN